MSIFMKTLLILTMLLIHHKTAYSAKPSTDYCKVACKPGTKHIICKRNYHCGPVKGCTMLPSTPAFREEMVKQHNAFREKIASGKEKANFRNRGAKNMKAVSYDMELEYIATCWTNMCKGVTRDDCKSSTRFQWGQNIFFSKGIGVDEIADAVPMWYNEIDHITNESWIDNVPDRRQYPDKWEPFVQVIWAETEYIGCARAKYGEDNMKKILICNYGPRGNIPHQSIYKHVADASEIASECGADGKNLEPDYPSLCGKIKPTPKDKSWVISENGSENIKPNLLCTALFIFISLYT